MARRHSIRWAATGGTAMLATIAPYSAVAYSAVGGAIAASSDTADVSGSDQQGSGPAVAGKLAVRVPLEVSLVVNGKFLGTISVAVDAKGDGEIDAVRLIDLLRPIVDAPLLSAITARIAGKTKVDFSDLDTGAFSIAFDSLALVVKGTLAADASLPSDLRLSAEQAIPIPSSFDQPSGFAAGLNIGLGQRYAFEEGGFERLRANLDLIANIGGFEGVTLTSGAIYDGQRWQRQETRLTHDLFDQGIRATVGEFTPSSTSFQGSGGILGVGVERAYSTIRPFQNTRPTGRQEFTLQRDSSVDVFVNQVRVQTIQLQAGRYNISDFPFAAGPNQIQLVVEDIGGRQEIVNFDVFNTTSLLTGGVSEFGGAVGIRQKGTLSYGFLPAATGYWYRGISDTLTLGINGQASANRVQFGGVATIGTRIGLFQLESATSTRFGKSGVDLALSFDYRGEFSLRSEADLRVVGSAVYRSAEFSDAFSRGTRNGRVLDTALQVQWLAPFGISTGAGVSYGLSRDGLPNSYRYDLTLGRSFGRIGATITGSRTVFSNGQGNESRVAIGLSVRLGRRDNVNARYDSGTHRLELEASRAPEGRLEEVSGYLRYTKEGDASDASARIAYVNNRFDLLVNHNRLESAGPGGKTSNSSDWNMRTAIGYAGGSFAVGRAIDEGFVVVPVHRSLKGSQAAISSGDRVIARSGLFGPALVPIGRAYGVSRYDVKVDPLPIGYDLGAGNINLFPGYGSGYRIMIGSDASHIAVGFLYGDDGPVALSSGFITPLDAKQLDGWVERSFFTNRAGRFVADRLAPGRYRLTLPGSGTAEFEIGEDTKGVSDVGTIHLAR